MVLTEFRPCGGILTSVELEVCRPTVNDHNTTPSKDNQRNGLERRPKAPNVTDPWYGLIIRSSKLEPCKLTADIFEDLHGTSKTTNCLNPPQKVWERCSMESYCRFCAKFSKVISPLARVSNPHPLIVYASCTAPAFANDDSLPFIPEILNVLLFRRHTCWAAEWSLCFRKKQIYFLPISTVSGSHLAQCF